MVVFSVLVFVLAPAFAMPGLQEIKDEGTARQEAAKRRRAEQEKTYWNYDACWHGGGDDHFDRGAGPSSGSAPVAAN